MKLILIAVLLSSIGASAQLPDAPQPQPTYLHTEVFNTPSTFKAQPRGKKKLLAIASVVAFAVSADIYDVRASERAFNHGYVESNGWLLCGENEVCRPSARSLYARDLGLELSLASLPSVLSYAFRRNELYYGFLTAPAVFGIKHIQGGNRASQLP